jgi:hypothetical protein
VISAIISDIIFSLMLVSKSNWITFPKKKNNDTAKITIAMHNLTLFFILYTSQSLSMIFCASLPFYKLPTCTSTRNIYTQHHSLPYSSTTPKEKNGSPTPFSAVPRWGQKSALFENYM